MLGVKDYLGFSFSLEGGVLPERVNTLHDCNEI